MRRAAVASVAVALILIVAKLVAWFITDSVALLSSLIDSLLDAGASAVNLLAVWAALRPADREHRFGHGKAEPIASLAQSGFVAGSALLVLFEAGQRLIEPQSIRQEEIGIGVMVFSLVATAGLVAYQRYVVARTASTAIQADSLHFQVDLLLNLGVILSLILATRLDWHFVDPLFGTIVVIYVLWAARRILVASVDMLMDRELPDADRLKILDMAREHPEVINVSEVRTRAAGADLFIQLHIEVAPSHTILHAHDIAHEVENRIRDAYPRAEVFIHQEPEGLGHEG
jgi:ferrous-iron efflux pump FieF